jgi:hypothetical protein
MAGADAIRSNEPVDSQGSAKERSAEQVTAPFNPNVAVP